MRKMGGGSDDGAIKYALRIGRVFSSLSNKDMTDADKQELASNLIEDQGFMLTVEKLLQHEKKDKGLFSEEV